MAQPRSDGTRGVEAVPAPPARLAAAVVVIALMPFPLVLHGWGNPKLPYDYLTIIFPVDLAFAALLLAALPALVRRLRQREAGAGTTLWVAFTVVMTGALLVHPSSRGLHTVFELWAIGALAGTVMEALAGQFADLIVGALVAVGVVEALWSAAQLVIGSSLGLQHLGEDAHPLWPFGGGVVAPMGSMVHPYVLAGLGLVVSSVAGWRALSATRPGWWLAGAAVAVAPVGFTFSRAAVLSLACIVTAFGAAALRPRARRERSLLVIAAICIGAAVPAALWNQGWRGRAAETTSATSAGQLTTERTHLVHEAATLIRANPAAGVGPGRYVPALNDHFGAEQDKALGNFRPVHNVVLLVGAEGGVLALLVMAALFVLLAWRAIRAGAVAVAVYVSYLPLAMLDHFPYSFPQGLVLTGFWIGLLDWISSRGRGSIRHGPAAQGTAAFSPSSAGANTAGGSGQHALP